MPDGGERRRPQGFISASAAGDLNGRGRKRRRPGLSGFASGDRRGVAPEFVAQADDVHDRPDGEAGGHKIADGERPVGGRQGRRGRPSQGEASDDGLPEVLPADRGGEYILWYLPLLLLLVFRPNLTAAEPPQVVPGGAFGRWAGAAWRRVRPTPDNPKPLAV